jgi:hypothetical protein
MIIVTGDSGAVSSTTDQKFPELSVIPHDAPLKRPKIFFDHSSLLKYLGLALEMLQSRSISF